MHHTKLFDHGILINRGSTDRSVEICKLFTPHWEIRDSKVLEFDAVLVDQEVMNIEKEITGWKMVLNTTEFLCCVDKHAFFSSLATLGKNMYAIRTILMVDDPTHGYTNPRYGIPLVKQRYHGRIIHPNPPAPYYGGRLIHNYFHGSYWAGRHWSPHPFPFTFPLLLELSNVSKTAFIHNADFRIWNTLYIQTSYNFRG